MNEERWQGGQGEEFRSRNSEAEFEMEWLNAGMSK